MTPTNPPPGCTVRPLTLAYLGEPFAWFRCVDAWDRIRGSGFTAAEAVEMAWAGWRTGDQ